MLALKHKKILLGITGGIAAYKAAILIRLLVKEGAEVQVVCTEAALDFVTPLSLSTLSKHPIHKDFIKNEQGEWTNHVELGSWAELMIIAPLSANTLAKMCSGITDNLLLATYLSAKCPVLVAPAMDLDMYAHPSTTRNLSTLAKDGINILDAQYGELASGLIGQGRMMEPEDIFAQVLEHFNKGKKLIGHKAVVSAGPTREAIDPVRFLSNRSTGTMGYAIAKELREQGAEVCLVSGPTQLQPPEGIELVAVESAQQMFEAISSIWASCSIGVMAAAVSDYRPKSVSQEKIKKAESKMDLSFENTRDILKYLGENKNEGQFLMGFALETQNELENAKKKLEKKNADAIILNSLKDEGAGFGPKSNKVSIVDRNKVIEHPLKGKTQVARDIVEYICSCLSES